MSERAFRGVMFMLLVLAAAGCGSGPSGGPSGSDDGLDVAGDAGGDTGVDIGQDSGADMALDAGTDLAGDDTCQPACEGKACGDDGCGGDCGTCPGEQEQCVDGTCICQPACDGKECGDDGCGGTCGTCPGDQDECVDGTCQCQPACDDKECGEDGCGGSCGTCSGAQELCIESACVCQPACEGKECGADGCDGVCGQCDEHFACEDDVCVFLPWCGDGDCDAGIDEDCGSCPADCVCGCGEFCVLDVCVFQGCKGKVCGSDGCGGSCGTCGCGETCTGGQCSFTACEGKLCGDDGCGGTCGPCGCGELCTNGQCHFTACDGKECGADGCGGICGACPVDEYCAGNQCAPYCGNGLCDNGETCKGCPGDCGLCCGNGLCDWGETSCDCPADCGPCGGCCKLGECLQGTADLSCGSNGAFCNNCTSLMKTCVGQACQYVCGDGLCAGGETCASCPQDCGSCCGNGACDNGESLETCPADCMAWVPVPGGNLVMGCAPGDTCAVFEEPEHGVAVAPFSITETEITEAQFDAVMGYNPSCSVSGGGGSDQPVECVPWPDAQDCCEAIGGRLCTEAEWEYAARGATTTKYYCGDSSSCVSGIGWHSGNSAGHKRPVKQKTPNGYGIYDMAGNVWEWVADCWHDSYGGAPSVSQPVWDYDCDDLDRVFRGGSFYNAVGSLRHSTRNAVDVQDPYAYADPTIGVRCCRSACGDGQCGAGETCANCPGDCGQCWTQESFISAGSFWMGCNAAVDTQCESDEYPYHQVYLSAYYIDRTEVTVQAYAACVAAGACTAPSISSSYHNWGVPGREGHPVNGVTWYQAQSYCTWSGKRLPTEAEWEKAARWTDGRKYPWGNEATTCQYAVMDEGVNGCGTDSTWPVCSRSPAGDSHYGLCDMAGNMWEWTADWYSSGYYSQSPANNPKGPTSGSYRVFRGGSFVTYAGNLRASFRIGGDPSYDYYFLGFRCARSE